MQRTTAYPGAALRRLALTIAGGVLLGAGVFMIVLPGPAILLIPAGLALLAMEYDFARRLLGRLRLWLSRQSRATRQRRK